MTALELSSLLTALALAVVAFESFESLLIALAAAISQQTKHKGIYITVGFYLTH